jgi:hypothetical protein
MNGVRNIERIKVLLTRSQLLDPNIHDDEIHKLLLEVFDELASANYEEANRIRNGLLDCSEQYHNLFFSHLYLLHQLQLRRLASLHMVEMPSTLDENGEEPPLDLLFGIFRFVLQNNPEVRLSSLTMPPIDIPEERLSSLLSIIIDVVQIDSASLQWSREDITHTIILLAIIRDLSIRNGRLYLFYALNAVVVERMNVAEEYQLSRDFGEEVFLTSLIDGQAEWGYFNLFKVFNGQLNINVAFIYANACLAALRRRSSVPDLLFKLFHFSLQRLYRNTGFKDEESYLYKTMLSGMSLDEFERFDITNTHIMTLASHKDQSAISIVYDYLVNNREFIFQRKHIAVPLLNTVYHVINIFGDSVAVDELSPYVSVLESVVGNPDAERLRALVRGESSHLKDIYIDQLSALADTRNAEDFVSEVRRPLVTANHLIKFGFEQQDIDAFLLGMILKSDRTWVFKTKRSATLQRISSEPRHHNEIDSTQLRNYGEYLKKELALSEEEACLWLTVRDGELFYLALTRGGFLDITILRNWPISAMNDWLAQEFKDLSFDETVKRGNQVFPYLEEDQWEDLRKLEQTLGFAKLQAPNAGTLFVIKDMLMSAMPHNLIMDLDGTFISRKSRLCCLPSAEWLIMSRENDKHLPKDFMVELWIPTDGGDFTLNLLWSRLSDTVRDYDIGVSTTEVPAKPLSGDINVLSAHGLANISSFHALFTRSAASIINLERVIGSGTVLILFVCHSGSAEKDIFRQKLLSLVKTMIGSGYQAVVAPFWAMHISIPPLWLPEFLAQMRNGATVSEAVFVANERVYEQNKNPGAWGCMHFYGNPDVRAPVSNAKLTDEH